MQRIKEKVFWPLLENNITPVIEDEEEEGEEDSKQIDGGKLNPKT